MGATLLDAGGPVIGRNSRDVEGNGQSLAASVHQRRDGMIADDEHPATGEAKTRDGQVGHVDFASNALSQPRGQLLDLIGWHFNEVLGLAGKDLMVFGDLVDQVGARGGRPTSPGASPNRNRDNGGKDEDRDGLVMSRG